MNRASHSGRPLRPDMASTAALTARNLRSARLPCSAPWRVWKWLQSCGRFARSASASQGGGGCWRCRAERIFREAWRPVPISSEPTRLLVADFRRQLACLLDQLLDRSFRGQHTDQPALDVDVFDVLGQPRRIAERELTYGCNAGCAHQPDLGLAHPGNAHVIREIGPF